MMEPVEELVIDVPEEYQGVVIAQVGDPARHDDRRWSTTAAAVCGWSSASRRAG